MVPYLSTNSKGVFLHLQVQPRSSKNMIVGPYGDLLKIKLKSPPVDGAANKECRRFLAKLLRVAPSDIEIVGGETSRKKRVLIHRLEIEDVEQILARAHPETIDGSVPVSDF